MPSPSIIRLYHLRRCYRKTDDKAITELVNYFDGDFAVDKIVGECELSSTSNSSEKEKTLHFQTKVQSGRKTEYRCRKQIPNKKVNGNKALLQ
jgi:hypothetical protein